jgi:hypothetical protein
MKNKILLTGIVVLLALPTSAWAADILGNWIAHWLPWQGTVETLAWVPILVNETVFSFKVDGTKLTGKVTNSQGETAISEGKIDGDEISFVVIRSLGGNEMKLVYKGKVDLNEIKFTCEAQSGMGQLQEFVAKREFQRNNGFLPVRRVPVRPQDQGERKIGIPEIPEK